MGKRRVQRGKVCVSDPGIVFSKAVLLSEACGKAGATHAHHIKTRSRGGDSSLENALHVCTLCHQKIHAGVPGYSKYLRHSWEEAPEPKMIYEYKKRIFNPMIFGRPK